MSHVMDVTDENFSSVIIESKLPFIVQVQADWSGECFLMSRIIDQLAQEYHTQIGFACVNIELNKNLAQEYGITELPFILFFDEGELVHHMIGLQSKNNLKEQIHFYFLKDTLIDKVVSNSPRSLQRQNPACPSGSISVLGGASNVY